MIIVDTRGLSCPEPIILTKSAISKGEKQIKVLIDSKVALENVSNFSETMGYKINVTVDKDEFILNLEK